MAKKRLEQRVVYPGTAEAEAKAHRAALKASISAQPAHAADPRGLTAEEWAKLPPAERALPAHAPDLADDSAEEEAATSAEVVTDA